MPGSDGKPTLFDAAGNLKTDQQQLQQGQVRS